MGGCFQIQPKAAGTHPTRMSPQHPPHTSLVVLWWDQQANDWKQVSRCVCLSKARKMHRASQKSEFSQALSNTFRKLEQAAS